MSGTNSGVVLHLGDQQVLLDAGETVLEALERAGVDAASGCRTGVCAKCLLRSDNPPEASQRGLRPTLKAQGYFFACQARPSDDLVIHGAEAPRAVASTVEAVSLVAPDVAQVLLRPSEPFEYRPGQYLDVLHPSGESRSYSVASLVSSGRIELHVRRVEGGLLSPWLHGLVPGAEVQIQGPFGQCFYVPEPNPPKKLLLVGAGTGLAPLLGIAREALAQSYAGRIDLVHGGLEPARLYLRDELADLASRFPSLHIHQCVLRGATERERQGALDQVAVEVGAPLTGSRAYLCGDEGIVRVLQRSLFLAGVPSGEILADPFSPAPVRD